MLSARLLRAYCYCIVSLWNVLFSAPRRSISWRRKKEDDTSRFCLTTSLRCISEQETWLLLSPFPREKNSSSLAKTPPLPSASCLTLHSNKASGLPSEKAVGLWGQGWWQRLSSKLLCLLYRPLPSNLVWYHCSCTVSLISFSSRENPCFPFSQRYFCLISLFFSVRILQTESKARQRCQQSVVFKDKNFTI